MAKPKRRRRTKQKPLAEILGFRVQALRAEQGLSRKALAEQARVSLTSLHLLEQGRTKPNLQTLERLASTLGLRVADLLDDEAPPPPRAVGTKVLSRLLDRLRNRDQSYLLAVERLLKAFDGALESAER